MKNPYNGESSRAGAQQSIGATNNPFLPEHASGLSPSQHEEEANKRKRSCLKHNWPDKGKGPAVNRSVAWNPNLVSPGNRPSYSSPDSDSEDAPEPKRPKDSGRGLSPTLSLSEENLCGDAAELDDVQEPSPIQDLAAALGKVSSAGKFVRLDDHATKDGDAIEVSTVGSYKMSIWNLDIREGLDADYFPLAPLTPNLTIRIPSTIMAAFGVATRACQLTNFNTVSLSVKERLGVGMPASTSTAFSRAYVGFSAFLMGDTYMAPGRNMSSKGKAPEGTEDQSARPRDIDLDDSAAGTQYKVEPGSKLVGANLIWHERCLVPGAIQTLKQLVHFDTPEDVPGDSDARLAAWAFLDREHTRALNGIHATPYGSKSPTNSGPNQPTMKGRYMHRGSDTHFMLKWPPLAAMEVPREMGTILERFLAAHPLDPMPLNLAVAATIIFFDLKDMGWNPEGFVKAKDGVLQTINPPPLGVFIIYFPHLLRFTEVRSLTRYVHPARFAVHNYERDRSSAGSMKIDFDMLDTARLGTLVSRIHTKTSKIHPRTRIALLPQSMPGTQMVWPRDVSTADPPSPQLFALCLLNDIRVLGLPSYHVRTEEHHQTVTLPLSLAINWVKQGPQWNQVDDHPAPSYWYPERRARLVSQTGSASDIGPIFNDMWHNIAEERKATEEHNVDEEPLSNLDNTVDDWGLHEMCNYPDAEAVVNFLTQRVTEGIVRVNEQRRQVALKLGLTLNDIRFSTPDLLISWHGLPSDLVRAAADGSLGRLNATPVSAELGNEVQIQPLASGALIGPMSTRDPMTLWTSETLKKQVKELLTCIGPQPNLYAEIRDLVDGHVSLNSLHRRTKDLMVGVIDRIQQVIRFMDGLDTGAESQAAVEKVLPTTLLRVFGAIEFNEGLSTDPYEFWRRYSEGLTGFASKIRTRVTMVLVACDEGNWEDIEGPLRTLLRMPEVSSMVRGGMKAWILVDGEMEKASTSNGAH